MTDRLHTAVWTNDDRTRKQQQQREQQLHWNYFYGSKKSRRFFLGEKQKRHWNEMQRRLIEIYEPMSMINRDVLRIQPQMAGFFQNVIASF